MRIRLVACHGATQRTFRREPSKIPPPIFFPKKTCLKKFLIFFRKKTFLVFLGMEPFFVQSKLEIKKNQPPKEFSKIEQKKNILSKERYSCGFGNGTLHFSVEVRKIKKYSSEKNSLSLRKRNFLALIFKTLLYFLKRNLFLYFGKWNPELLIPSSKSKKILPEKIFLYFRKWKP